MTEMRFYNVWRTKTPKDRAGLIATMNERPECLPLNQALSL